MPYLCAGFFNRYSHFMFDFDQYLGFLAFLAIFTLGFWLMIFLITFVIPYWIGGYLLESFKERRAKRKEKQIAATH